MAGADDWSVLGEAPAQLQNPWAVRQVAPAPVGVGDVVKGVGDAALSGASKLATGAVGGVLGLVNRLVAAGNGGDPEMASQVTKEFVNKHFGYDTQTPVGRQIGQTTQQTLAPVGTLMDAAGGAIEKGGEALGVPTSETQAGLHELGELATAVPAASALKTGADASLAAEAAQTAAKTANPFEQLGLKTSVDHPVARAVAGSSGREALGLQNQQVGNTVAGAQAGVVPGTPIDYQPLEDARAAPNAVYGRVAAALPTGPLSPNAQAAIQAVGSGANRITAGSQNVQDTIQGLKDSLLDAHGNFSGDQVINESRGLRQEGGVGVASDDVDQQAIGHAKLQMAKALETHVVDSLPADAPVTLDQFQQARTALAKNYAVQSALKGNDVDLQSLGRIQRADPDLMTGDLQTLGDFANKHPEVSTLPSAGTRYSPPGLGKDLGSVNIINPRTWVQPLLGALARRSMTGAPGEAAAAAASRPVSGLGDQFAPIDRTPQPPPGLTAGPMGAPAAPAGPPGQIPLADVLSHGVEQSPPEGLSLAPDASSGPSGIPFQRDAGHESGLLGLIDDLAGPTQNSTKGDDSRDLGAVMSQGVPEGIMQRTPPRAQGTQPAIDFPTGAQHASFVNNNASAESPASLEAVNRTAQEAQQGRTRFMVDPDGNVTPIPGVEAADAKAPKGGLVIQRGGGGEPFTILDRGGLPQSHAKGLLNRAITKLPLGDNF